MQGYRSNLYRGRFQLTKTNFKHSRQEVDCFVYQVHLVIAVLHKFSAFLVNMGYVLVLFPLQEALVQEIF